LKRDHHCCQWKYHDPVGWQQYAEHSGRGLSIAAGAQLNLSAGTGININTASIISVMGTQIRLNGSTGQVARVSDAVNGTQILTGSPSVVTN